MVAVIPVKTHIDGDIFMIIAPLDDSFAVFEDTIDMLTDTLLCGIVDISTYHISNHYY